MLTVAQALAAVLEQRRPLPPAACPLVEALGCVLAEDVVADRRFTAFRQGAGRRLRGAVGRHLAARDRWLGLGETDHGGPGPRSSRWAGGEAAVVMTGAPVPPECDAVVMHERTEAA